MDYFEKLNDPLKYYFKEKIGNLYINRTVINLFINKGNRGEVVEEEKEEITDSIFNFPELKELKDKPKTESTRKFINRLVHNDSAKIFNTKEEEKNSSKGFLRGLSFSKKKNKHKKKRKPRKMRNSIEIYNDKRNRKKTEINDMIDNLANKQFIGRDTEINKVGSKFSKFRKNDNMIRETLDVQTSSINSKLFERRQKSMIRSSLIRFEQTIEYKCF